MGVHGHNYYFLLLKMLSMNYVVSFAILIVMRGFAKTLKLHCHHDFAPTRSHVRIFRFDAFLTDKYHTRFSKTAFYNSLYTDTLSKRLRCKIRREMMQF